MSNNQANTGHNPISMNILTYISAYNTSSHVPLKKFLQTNCQIYFFISSTCGGSGGEI